ncbi:hypothetical protein FHS19_000986 [Paenibacillus rhizosphaerae]|uniref:Uncharacterized protein n=1 Tax=Paenibacillus rhizosphaerae TaxID=297318 RepID=A0A839TI75_9BACL|nr:hypothetical protein [Paenibacillus rhizosphaerae]MBB3126332.1 hypothetical protein [Paenibacillus rhizosphaerae]
MIPLACFFLLAEQPASYIVERVDLETYTSEPVRIIHRAVRA